MTAPQLLPHVQALAAAISALPGTPLTVYIGGAPTGPAPLPDTYVVLYPDAGTVVAASLADDRTELAGMVQATCVGSTPEGAIGTADRVAQAWNGATVVAGRACWRPERLGGPPLARDDDLVPAVWYLAVQYGIHSIPA
ncbi:hypothetical protein [Kitasatospora cineracea]|uniref:DUF3168 domain-containing protein n=1 Tax=Kitasatospora cineracea TaxID=88074 RepID=A0A3N4R258_9ACTN|nr:hypothetical protein [Kitasatospora cineracea]RPE27282.1 hypothetical protein EDD38_7427 [Kitasatospora cineracea]